MPLVPFAKVSDLQLLVPGMVEDSADLLLELVSGMIRDSIGWNVDKVVDAVYTKVVPASRGTTSIASTCGYLDVVVLPALNVTNIKSVVQDSVTLTSADYSLNGSAGIIRLDSPAYTDVVVTYTAGYVRAPVDTLPSTLRAVALDYAARWNSNPGGNRSYTMGLVTEFFAEDMKSLIETDVRLDPYRVNQ